MPTYQLIVLAQPSASAEKLAQLMRGVARLVYREQGQFRTVSVPATRDTLALAQRDDGDEARRPPRMREARAWRGAAAAASRCRSARR